MGFLSNLPLPVLVLLIFIIFLLIVGTIVFLLTKSGKPKETDAVPQQGQPLEQAQEKQSVSPKLAKPSEGKFIFLIIGGALLALFIPVLAVLLVKNQAQISPTPTSQSLSSPSCSAVTIADTLGNPLNQSALGQLRPGDEVKIIIAANRENLEKARFRVNGSQWQEVTIKDGSNFTGNYILSIGTKKFTVEAEVYDKEKGWL